MPYVSATYRVPPSMIQLVTRAHRYGICTAWAPGTSGGHGKSLTTQFHQCPFRCREVPEVFVDKPTAFGPTAYILPSSIHRHARMLPGTAFGVFGCTGKVSHDPVSATDRRLPLMIQLLLALRLAGPRAPFFAIPAYYPWRHFHGMSPGDVSGG